LRNPNESGNASREIPAKDIQDQEQANARVLKLTNKAKQRAISHYFFRRCKAVLSNYLSEDELKKCARLKKLKSK
jgi:hypothetical protein